MIGRIYGVVALAVVAALLAVGCGDGSEASSNVTKAQFIKEADAVCAERKKEWNAKGTRFTKEFEADEAGFKEAKKRSEAFFTEDLLPLLETELEALEDLDVPEVDEAKVERMLQNRSQGVEKLQANGVQALLKGSTFDDFEKEAKAYGLDCPLA